MISSPGVTAVPVYAHADGEVTITAYTSNGLTAEIKVTATGTGEKVYVAKEIRTYISAIAAASRRSGALQLGVSTRAAIALLKASQACALLDGRDFVKPEDVQKMAEPVLAHRLVLSPEARMRNMTPQRVLSNVMGAVQVPVKVK